ncbi:hypothetical protein [Bradyrhizobium sp. 2S1]|uniref:hypothetical protein n=1 Tax=Bradyrhizobium sp. 2S1 TaxID=1404429 RepID=UPI0014077D68|nr:hypothetical protein [Bradyrhizobium sp. 2S1]MCK7665046.1 hypothetical protein [Bradyrhizobium sp. 2S1]
MSQVLNLLHAEVISSASMFAVEFTHPITGLIVRDGLRVAAEGYGPPIKTFSGRFAWNEIEKPADREIVITAESTDGRFAPLSEKIKVPAHVKEITPDKLLFRLPLAATGLLEPPDGVTAFAGQLLAGTPPVAMRGVAVRLVLREDRQTVSSDYVSKTDDRGGFVAVMKGDDEITPVRRSKDQTIDCWIEFDNGSVKLIYEIPDLRFARLVRAAERLIWEQLKPPPP